MIPRLRMARKRLHIAITRKHAAYETWAAPDTSNAKWERWCRRLDTLRAIERRKDRIA